MGFGKSTPATPTKPKIKIEPPTGLTSRYSFRDHRRNGESIIIAPANNLGNFYRIKIMFKILLFFF